MYWKIGDYPELENFSRKEAIRSVVYRNRCCRYVRALCLPAY
jgi:hypothetical protein